MSETKLQNVLLLFQTHVNKTTSLPKLRQLFLEIGKYLRKEKVKPSDLTSKFIFSGTESMFCEPFPQNTNEDSQYLP